MKRNDDDKNYGTKGNNASEDRMSIDNRVCHNIIRLK